MSSIKERISSPLEAGQSIHDGHHLPANLTQALEYVSKRLARKAHHVTLAVVRKDYQLPASAAIPPPSPALSSPPTSPGMMPSPSRLAFKPASKLRSLVRSTNHPVLNSAPGTRSPGLRRSATASPTCTDTTTSPRRWPGSPGSPMSFGSIPSTPGTPSTMPPTPRSAALGSVPPTPRSPPFMNPLTAHPPTPRTPATPYTMPPTPATPWQPNAIKLVYAMAPSVKADKALRQTVEKAEKKFGLGASYAPLQAHHLPSDLLRRSILQNEVLFSSEGLTLLSLDRLYTFKASVASYHRSPSTFRLEDAVDELRRLVLASRRSGNSVIGGADEHGHVNRSFLMRSYDFLGVTSKALRDVERAYASLYRADRDKETTIAGRMSGSTLVERDSKVSAIEEEPEHTTPTQTQPQQRPQPAVTIPPQRPGTNAQDDDDDDDDIPEPFSPLKEPRDAPLPPTIHSRRKASPPPPAVSIPPTPIDGVVHDNWPEVKKPQQQQEMLPRATYRRQNDAPTLPVASPRRALSPPISRMQSPRQPAVSSPQMSLPSPRITSPQLPALSTPRVASPAPLPASRVASPQQHSRTPAPPIEPRPEQEIAPGIFRVTSSVMATDETDAEEESQAESPVAATPGKDVPADSPHSFNIPIMIPPTAAVNLAHRPEPDPTSPIDRLPINFPTPLLSPGKGPQLRLQTSFSKDDKSLPPLPLQPKSPRNGNAADSSSVASPASRTAPSELWRAATTAPTTATATASCAGSPAGATQTPLTGTSLDAPIVMSVPSPTALTSDHFFPMIPRSPTARSPTCPPAPTTSHHPSTSAPSLVRPVPRPRKPASPTTPKIKIDTSVAVAAAASARKPTHPPSAAPRGRFHNLGAGGGNGGMTIDSILCPTNDGEGFPISAHPDGPDGMSLGPMTPNGYDDISPITRGEWGMLMFGDGMKGRTVAVETC